MRIADIEGVTGLLAAWSGGDKVALERLLSIVYGWRKDICVASEGMRWQRPAHFCAVSALMRRILVTAARARAAQKRGDGAPMVALDDAILQADAGTTDVFGVNLVPDRLAAIDGRKARVVDLRVFAALTVEESAEVLHVSPDTVMRDWSIAKSSLARELGR